MILNRDKGLVNINNMLNGNNTKKRSRQTVNNTVNFTPNRDTLASTDHTSLPSLLGRLVTVE